MLPTLYEVGKPFPGMVPSGEGVTMALLEGGALIQIWLFPSPSPEEIGAFRGMWRWAIYQGEDMPGGLALCAVGQGRDHLPQEIPFSWAAERTGRPQAVQDWLDRDCEPGRVPMLNAFLVDPRTTLLHAMKVMGPPPSWLDRLHLLWQTQGSADAYYADYQRLISRPDRTTDELWRLAQKFE